MKVIVGIFLSIAVLLLCGVSGSRGHGHRAHDPVVNKLPITLYYEALCPYCMDFVVHQLYPSMKQQGRLNYTELNLVPYGNAKKGVNGTFVCQHGADECELNAWHGCILEHHAIPDALKLISCMMRSRKNKLDKCSTHFNIDVSDVKKCKKSRTVDDILRKYGEETDKVTHRGVPAIAVDNHYDENEQENLTDYFDDVFCAKYEAKFNKKLANCL